MLKQIFWEAERGEFEKSASDFHNGFAYENCSYGVRMLVR